MTTKPPKKKKETEERIIYKNLEQALRRSTTKTKMKINEPGKVASLLLKVFTTPGLNLSQKLVIEYRLCTKEKNDYKKWREPLEKGEFLITTKKNGIGKVWTEYLPGPKLNKYVNKLKMLTQTLATVEELNFNNERADQKFITIDKYQELLNEIKSLKKAIKEIEKENPPVTLAKIDNYMQKESGIKFIQ